jgi:3-oxoacyl-[acyl-carrier protein] reductase
MNIDLSGKMAVVCGSTQGIGKAVSIELANSGAAVTLVARNEEALKQVLSELKTKDNQIHKYVCVDFSHPEELRSKIGEYVKSNRPVHILVNNTGGPPPGLIFDAETLAFEEGFKKHIICNQILVQALVPGMETEKYGRIINIISTGAKQPIPGLGVSNTIRGAVANWAKTLAGELAPLGITVNNILPGYTATQRLRTLIEAKASKSGKSIREIEKEYIDVVPAGRFAEAEEIAYAVLFLASTYSAYITGTSLPVDGGRIPSL